MNTQSAAESRRPRQQYSISGVHGRDELNERLANAPPQYHDASRGRARVLLLGAAIGATIMYLLKR